MWMPLLLEKSVRPPGQWSNPAGSALTFGWTSLRVPPGQATLASVQLARTPDGRWQLGRSVSDRQAGGGRLGVEEGSLCGLGLLRGGSSGSFLHKGRSSHQLSGGTNPASPFLSSLFPLPASLSSLSPQAANLRVKGQGFTRPALFPALLLAPGVQSRLASHFLLTAHCPPKSEQKQISELPPPLCSPL